MKVLPDERLHDVFVVPLPNDIAALSIELPSLEYHAAHRVLVSGHSECLASSMCSRKLFFDISGRYILTAFCRMSSSVRTPAAWSKSVISLSVRPEYQS